MKAAKKKGIVKSDNTIKLMGITIYITNISNNVLQTEHIHEIYSLRWQVEIIFKIWKSIFCLSHVKNVKIERFKCQLYGKLILLVLSSIIIFNMRSQLVKKEKLEVSEIKSSEIISQYIKDIYFCFIENTSNIGNILSKVLKCMRKNGQKSHRKDKKTFFDILGVSYNCQERRCETAA